MALLSSENLKRKEGLMSIAQDTVWKDKVTGRFFKDSDDFESQSRHLIVRAGQRIKPQFADAVAEVFKEKAVPGPTEDKAVEPAPNKGKKKGKASPKAQAASSPSSDTGERADGGAIFDDPEVIADAVYDE